MIIDLRSDTVTLPSPAMREAMYRAEVGDDVYGEDPTINRLQELAAERTGKEAALFVPSGTMGNTAAVLAHAGRGEAVMVGDQSHIYRYEVGGASTVGGSPMYVVPTDAKGMLDLHQVEIGISDGSDEHSAPTALLCIENTHNRCGGAVLNVEQVEVLVSLAHAHGVKVHMDGARIFNAATALGVQVSTLAQPVDSNRLAEDHENCKRLAFGLADFPQIDIDVERVVTNIVNFSVRNAQQERMTDAETMQFLEKAREHSVLMGTMGEGTIRTVTHYGLNDEDIMTALGGIRRALIDMQIA